MSIGCTCAWGVCLSYTVKNVVHVSEHPKGAIFSCFHGNPNCYHGNRKILLPWGVQLHHNFYSVGVTWMWVFNNNPIITPRPHARSGVK